MAACLARDCLVAAWTRGCMAPRSRGPAAAWGLGGLALDAVASRPARAPAARRDVASAESVSGGCCVVPAAWVARPREARALERTRGRRRGSGSSAAVRTRLVVAWRPGACAATVALSSGEAWDAPDGLDGAACFGEVRPGWDRSGDLLTGWVVVAWRGSSGCGGRRREICAVAWGCSWRSRGGLGAVLAQVRNGFGAVRGRCGKVETSARFSRRFSRCVNGPAGRRMLRSAASRPLFSAHS